MPEARTEPCGSEQKLDSGSLFMFSQFPHRGLGEETLNVRATNCNKQQNHHVDGRCLASHLMVDELQFIGIRLVLGHLTARATGVGSMVRRQISSPRVSAPRLLAVGVACGWMVG